MANQQDLQMADAIRLLYGGVGAHQDLVADQTGYRFAKTFEVGPIWRNAGQVQAVTHTPAPQRLTGNDAAAR